MTKTPLILALAASAAFGVLPSLAAAQSYGPSQGYDQQSSYQAQQDAYQQRLRDYNGQNSGRYNYDRYRREGCRMVAVPSEWNDGQTRYARACPDSHGRYRLTD